MRTIIHDLEDTSFLKLNDTDVLVSDAEKSCIGCFSCWVRKPLECVHKDNITYNGKKILESDELIIISKFTYGTYSSKVKKIIERSISFVEPFFTIRNGEIHHKVRIDKKINFKVESEYFNLAKELFQENGLNLTSTFNVFTLEVAIPKTLPFKLLLKYDQQSFLST